MVLSKKVTDINETLGLDIQLIATELDTSAKFLKYLSKDIMGDGIMQDAFDVFVKVIETVEGDEITSFDDNTILYEFSNEAVVIHESLGIKYIIFDSSVTQKVEANLAKYKVLE